MKTIPATRALNPAFKRNQCLPELLPARPCSSASAAPHAAETRAETTAAGSPRADTSPQQASGPMPADEGFAITS